MSGEPQDRDAARRHDEDRRAHGARRVRVGTSVTACDACLRRAWLLDRLGAHLETAHLSRRPVRDVLALDDEDAVRALCGGAGDDVLAELEAAPVGGVRRMSGRAGLTTTCRHREPYPGRLLDERSAPAALFLADPDGAAPDRLRDLVGARETRPPSVAIVGTRRASADGVEVARALGRGLSAAGVTVVSGMAMGVDAAAHDGALAAGGRTVAVLAGGADVPYPRGKWALHRRIAASGVVLSEQVPGAPPRRWAFPARNRTIAALADAVVVVEAAERSGSLITAGLALDLGREVCAVPGPVLSWRAAGTNSLLRDGALLVRDAGDVLEAVLGVAEAAVRRAGDPPPPAGLPDELAALLAAVEDGRDTIGALARDPDQAARVAAALGELELQGHLRRLPGGRYRRVAA